jgi:hypothetical protein
MPRTVWGISQGVRVLGISLGVAFSSEPPRADQLGSIAMKHLAFLGFAIATLIAPIQLQAQQYDPARNCVRFPQRPNPEAEIRYLTSHPNITVCPAENPNPAGHTGTVQKGLEGGYNNTMSIIRAQRGYY